MVWVFVHNIVNFTVYLCFIYCVDINLNSFVVFFNIMAKESSPSMITIHVYLVFIFQRAQEEVQANSPMIENP